MLTPDEFHDFVCGEELCCELIKNSFHSSPITWALACHRDHFPGKIFKPLGYHCGAEIGIMAGAYSKLLIETLGGPIYLVDSWQHLPDEVYNDSANVPQKQQEEIYKGICEKYGDINKVRIIKDFSENAVKQVEDRTLDFVFIDANHSYHFVREDLNMWWEKLKVGGLMTGHDLSDQRGVEVAVLEFIKKKGINRWYEANANSYLFVKPDN